MRAIAASLGFGFVVFGALTGGSTACVLSPDTLGSSSGSSSSSSSSSSGGGVPEAGPPEPCTASPSSSPFCTPGSGVCPLLADDTITCPAPGILATGLTQTETVGIATAASQGGALAFAVLNSTSQDQYLELGTFDAKGLASFTVDTSAPTPYAQTGGSTNAGILVVSGPGGVPVILDTIGGGLRAVVGPATACERGG
jgi:hypothetical protein